MDAVCDGLDITEGVLDQAIAWAVVMGAEDVDAVRRRAFEQWLQAHALHRVAWKRVQLVESEFTGVRQCQSFKPHAGVDIVQRLRSSHGPICCG